MVTKPEDLATVIANLINVHEILLSVQASTTEQKALERVNDGVKFIEFIFNGIAQQEAKNEG